jgi:hypothetical protein
MESKILELQKMVSKYTTTWSNIQEQMNEFTLVYVARWRGKDGKRYASPFKTKDSAEKRAKELRTQGNSEVSVTQDTLKGNIKWAKDNGPDIKGMQKEDVAINMLEAMSPAQIKKLKDSWAEIKLMSPEKVKTLKNFLDKYSTDTLMQLAQSGINFVSNMARSVAMKRKTGDMKHAGSMKEEMTDSERMAKMRASQMALQTKIKDFDVGDPKDKTKIAIAKNDLENIQMKMDQLKNKTQKEEVHPAKALLEKLEGLKNKAEKTGMPYSILKQVYNRGMAAWKGGHRPGTTPQQWAMARVNSFVTKSSGTWGGADKDLAKKVRSSK